MLIFLQNQRPCREVSHTNFSQSQTLPHILMNTGKSYPNHQTLTKLINKSIKHNYLEILIWLYSCSQQKISLCADFLNGCSSGSIDIILWLHNTQNVDVSILKIAFETACCDNNVQTAKLLHILCDGQLRSVLSNKIELFENACLSGYLKIAKILHELGAKIIVSSDTYFHNSFDDIFIRSCKRGHMHIAKWLAKMIKCYRVTGRNSINGITYVKIEKI